MRPGSTHRQRSDLRSACALAVALAAAAVFSGGAHPVSAQGGSRARRAAQARTPLPSPLIEREEVRFVTLDLVVEERAPSGWRPAADLRQEQVLVRVGGQEVELEMFETWCRSGAEGRAPAPGAPPTAAAPGAPPDESTGPATVPTTGEPPGEFPPLRYVLYFDFAHLKQGGYFHAFMAAEKWVAETVQPTDEVMILTGSRGLRIVRPMKPASIRLEEDLESAKEGFLHGDMWAHGEDSPGTGRIREIKERGRPWRQEGLANIYGSIDFSRTRQSLQNLEHLMAVFESIEGTKNLIFFEQTVRMVPGIQYPNYSNNMDIEMFIRGVARAANEHNVRVYPVYAGGLGGRVDGSLTMLASETGGRWVDGSNDLGTVFDRVAADASCSYRIGFSMRPEFSGRTERIVVEVSGDGRYRLRYRRTLDDPTREEREADRLRAALLDPGSADDFPVTVTTASLVLRGDRARVRIQVTVALASLLDLPAGEPGTEARQVRLQIGGTVVPLRPREPDAEELPSDWIWERAAEERSPWSFADGAVLMLPARRATDTEAPGSVVLAREIDVPPGDYRLVTAVQDRLAGEISARVTDFRVEGSAAALGEIHLAVEDPRGVFLDGDESKPSGGPRKKRIVPATRPLLAEVLMPQTAGLAPHHTVRLFYPLCNPESRAQSRKRSEVDVDPFAGWKLTRELTCRDGALPVELVGSPVRLTGAGGGCVLMVDSIPGGTLPPGRCRFEVGLTQPDGASTVRALEFQVEADERVRLGAIESAVVSRLDLAQEESTP